MNYIFTILLTKLRRHNTKEQFSQGFTLIELLVVTFIIGVLSTIALPNYLLQVGKAREAEVKNMLGILARAQQAYHFEKKVFASDYEDLNLEGNFESKYYSFLIPESPDNFEQVVKHQVKAIDGSRDGIRDYAIGVYYSDGNFDNLLCQGRTVGEMVNVTDDNNSGDFCSNSGEKLN